MTLIETIASHAAAGLTAAESASRLREEHALSVGEAWVEKVRGADGFAAAYLRAEAAVGRDAPQIGDGEHLL